MSWPHQDTRPFNSRPSSTLYQTKDQPMTTSSRIVVGVDGSPASVSALRWAARQAALTDSSLEATISWEYPMQYGNELLYEGIDWVDLARSTLATALAEADPGMEINSVVTEGHPAQVLIAASADADLLVVGSRGRGGFAGLILGSVSQYVTAHASCPVLVVRAPDHPAPAAQQDS
ncbi:universal stress protein [Microlunatus aurantiacus]|uniref:Universal stress protein n=1 Tax=Microlunatus aurantiacus TaxID=446786 RepID=A0ABP7EHU4_9ACTN